MSFLPNKASTTPGHEMDQAQCEHSGGANLQTRLVIGLNDAPENVGRPAFVFPSKLVD